MSGEHESGKSGTAAPEAEEVARRYLDLWQDQMTALAADPEFAAAWRKLIESMGAQATAWQAQGMPAAGGLQDPMAVLQAMMAGVRPATGGPGADHGQERSDDDGVGEEAGRGTGEAAQRAAAPAAASRGSGHDLEQLAARLDQLEARLAALETQPAGPRGGPRKRDRKPRS